MVYGGSNQAVSPARVPVTIKILIAGGFGVGKTTLVGSLTEREVEVLGCLGQGLSNAQIAARLYLSEATIKGYVSRMLDKLGCANRTQAGLLAHDAGLIGR